MFSHGASQWGFLWDVPLCSPSGFMLLLLWSSSCPSVSLMPYSSQVATATISVLHLEFICCSKQLLELSPLSHPFSGPCHWIPSPRILLRPHLPSFLLPLGCPFLSCIGFFYLSCTPPQLPMSLPQCCSFNRSRQGGSELLSAPPLEKHCSL